MRQSDQMASTAQMEEVMRLRKEYFERNGVWPHNPFKRGELPSMARAGKYIGDLREALGKSRSSRKDGASEDREKELLEDMYRKGCEKVWFDLYQKVHGPTAVMAVPDDLEGEIKKLREELVTISHKKTLLKRIDFYREQLGLPDLDYRSQNPVSISIQHLINIARDLSKTRVMVQAEPHRNTRSDQSSGQLRFFAELDGKRVDITEDVHKFIASKEPEIRECAAGAVRCPHCGSEKIERLSKDGEFITIFGCENCDKSFFQEQGGIDQCLTQHRR